MPTSPGLATARARSLCATRGTPAPPTRAALCALATALVACGPRAAPNPFGFGGLGGLGQGGGGEGVGGDGGGGVDPTLGGPCEVDAQCDDGLGCTLDTCDPSLSRCRFVPDDLACQNGLYCDGAEVCDPKLGCVAGTPITCSDQSPCTIDACVEATGSCSHVPRDLDGDGDPDVHCGGGDCDDTNPKVSSLGAEVCQNLLDDDCDGSFDEAECFSPQHDTCVDPLVITAAGPGPAGVFELATFGAALDFSTACNLMPTPAASDVVAALVLPPGPLVDVEVTARSGNADVALSLAGQCGDPSTELACSPSYLAPTGGKLAKLRAYGLGSASDDTALPIVVTTSVPAAVTLEVALFPASSPPPNETCGTALPLAPGVATEGVVVGVSEDVASLCATPVGELVYAFTLDDTYDVDLYAVSLDGDGVPSLSLRDTPCALPDDELACITAQNAHIFRHSMGPGTFLVATSASAPSHVSTTLELSPPTPMPPEDACSTAPPITPWLTEAVAFTTLQDDHQLGCLLGVDGAWALTLDEPSDVLAVLRIAPGDVGGVSLATPACTSAPSLLACGAGAPSPVRVAKYAMAPGDYRVVAESVQAQSAELTVLVRPASPPLVVPFADGCGDFVDIPETGGVFQGTTANASPTFSAGCDQGGVPQGGAPDQLLRLVLTAPRRVIFDMAGSGYNTLLDVRKGDVCPGNEVLDGCAIGVSQQRSFLDLDLEAGTYWVQVDGFNMDAGPWKLDVHVSGS